MTKNGFKAFQVARPILGSNVRGNMANAMKRPANMTSYMPVRNQGIEDIEPEIYRFDRRDGAGRHRSNRTLFSADIQGILCKVWRHRKPTRPVLVEALVPLILPCDVCVRADREDHEGKRHKDVRVLRRHQARALEECKLAA